MWGALGLHPWAQKCGFPPICHHSEQKLNIEEIRCSASSGMWGLGAASLGSEIWFPPPIFDYSEQLCNYVRVEIPKHKTKFTGDKISEIRSVRYVGPQGMVHEKNEHHHVKAHKKLH